MSENTQTCMSCGKEIKGRYDKKYCDDVCRNAWHNTQNKNDETQIRIVNGILKKNRRVLKAMNVTGKQKVRKEDMLKNGFDFSYLTKIYTTQKGSTYYFCYEQGYLALENDWFMLVVDQRT